LYRWQSPSLSRRVRGTATPDCMQPMDFHLPWCDSRRIDKSVSARSPTWPIASRATISGPCDLRHICGPRRRSGLAAAWLSSWCVRKSCRGRAARPEESCVSPVRQARGVGIAFSLTCCYTCIHTRIDPPSRVGLTGSSFGSWRSPRKRICSDSRADMRRVSSNSSSPLRSSAASWFQVAWHFRGRSAKSDPSVLAGRE
jgi:hypothetical protein